MAEIWAVEPDDVRLARDFSDAYSALGARDLIHLACCQRRGVKQIKTFDRALGAAFGG
jgi:predicted nucleic acid-binding protein